MHSLNLHHAPRRRLPTAACSGLRAQFAVRSSLFYCCRRIRCRMLGQITHNRRFYCHQEGALLASGIAIASAGSSSASTSCSVHDALTSYCAGHESLSEEDLDEARVARAQVRHGGQRAALSPSFVVSLSRHADLDFCLDRLLHHFRGHKNVSQCRHELKRRADLCFVPRPADHMPVRHGPCRSSKL